ncbi:hypothetical protein [Nannocystis pusilla]|uniref:hypothetical protein n=1 Tax=Nannocystis pusilla TaxID=889268 RepID=UPI003B7C6BF7
MAQQLLNAFEKSGGIAAGLREPPAVRPKFSGQPGDIVAQAEALFRQQRALTVAQLMTFHAQQGGTLSPSEAMAALLAAEWNLDGAAWDELMPRDAYVTGGDLWDRHDRAAERARGGDEQAKVQVRRLLEAIKPAVFDDLTDIDPRHGYVPLELLEGWLSSTLNAKYGPMKLERAAGLLQIEGHQYTNEELPPVSPGCLAFLGYYNHDPEFFKPPSERRPKGDVPSTKEEKPSARGRWPSGASRWRPSGPSRSGRTSLPTRPAASAWSTPTTASRAAGSSPPTRPSPSRSPAGGRTRRSSSRIRSPVLAACSRSVAGSSPSMSASARRTRR